MENNLKHPLASRYSSNLVGRLGSLALLLLNGQVARKIGGIYTVLTSKASVTVREWGDRYLCRMVLILILRFAFVGPYFKRTAMTEFDQSIRPSHFVQGVMDRCWERHGIKIYFGRWLVTAGMLVHE
jgi:glycogen(starch) synthase